MANYYTHASFILPCSAEQAAEAIEALNILTRETTDCDELAISVSMSDEVSKTECLPVKERIIRYSLLSHPDQDSEDTVFNLDWQFTVEPCSEGLWIHFDESINTEHAAIFTQAVLKAYQLPALIEIQASHACDKPRIDAYGGHACVVTKDYIHWNDLYKFVQAEEKAHKEQVRYYSCDLIEINGEYEYTYKFLMSCKDSQSPDERLDEIFTNLRGNGVKQDDDYVLFGDGTAAKNPCHYEITPLEYQILQEHLSVL